MKKIIVLGATGSLGRQTAEVLNGLKNNFKVVGLACKNNIKELNTFGEDFFVLKENRVLTGTDGEEALIRLVTMDSAEVIVNNLPGTVGFKATEAALKEGKIVLLANKESLVAGGKTMMSLPGKIIPIDSEHNAIFEILNKFPQDEVERIFIPCSGGPFWGKSKNELEKVSVADALNHPRWNMGNKVSIESATLINKGLELIEAHYLFDLPLSKIESFLHPECKIHGIVKFKNFSAAYFGEPDMKEHIKNALLVAINMPTNSRVEIVDLDQLNLQSASNANLPGIEIVLKFFEENKMEQFLKEEEYIVDQFLKGEIKFLDIYSKLEDVYEKSTA